MPRNISLSLLREGRSSEACREGGDDLVVPAPRGLERPDTKTVLSVAPQMLQVTVAYAPAGRTAHPGIPEGSRE